MFIFMATQVPLVQVAVRVVEQIQVFDQQVAAMVVCPAGADQRGLLPARRRRADGP
jgi:hypothetical protein